MTDHTPAAQAAPHEAVLTDQRINELWIAQRQYHGGEPTRLSHLEFARAIEQELSKLRAPVADERDRHTTISAVFSRCSLIPGATFWNAAEFMYDEMHRRAAMPRDPIADEEAFQAWADRFPEISDMGRLREAWHAALASAPVAGMKPLEPEFAKVLSDNFDSLMVRLPSESAPVAGEAQPVAEVVCTHVYGWATRWIERDGKRNIPPLGTLLYAAPQASEAVRDALRSAAQQITDLYEGDEWPELAQVLHVLDALSSQPGAQKENGHEA